MPILLLIPLMILLSIPGAMAEESKADVYGEKFSKYEKQFSIGDIDLGKEPVGTPEEASEALVRCILFKLPVHLALGGTLDNYDKVEAASYCAWAADDHFLHEYAAAKKNFVKAQILFWTYVDAAVEGIKEGVRGELEKACS